MEVKTKQIDLVQILNLDKILSLGEIEEFLDQLTKEIIYRFLFEELPKLINKKDYQNLVKKYRTGSNIDLLFEKMKRQWPKIDFDKRIVKITTRVKKEFAKNYLLNMKEDFKDEKMNKIINSLSNELVKKNLNLKKMEQLREKMEKRLNYLTKK